MKKQNKREKVLLVCGGIILGLGLMSMDYDNFSYDLNKKSYFQIIAGIFFILSYFIRIYFEKNKSVSNS